MRPAESHLDPDCNDQVAGLDTDLGASELYRDHCAHLVVQLTRRTGCPETAWDLAQGAFEKLLRLKPGRLQAIGRPDAYLRRLATNLAHDWGRSRAVADRANAHLELHSDRLSDQVAALEARDTLRRLEAALNLLKPKTREIFLAHRLHGLSYAEIAERTGLSVKGVEKQMSKAIAKIDRLLDRT